MSYIGELLKDRMKLLDLSANELADMTFMDESSINAIINNTVSFDDIDEFDISLICSSLHCKPEFFTEESVREKDLLMAAMNRGNDNRLSMNIKAKIQDFMNDFAFVNEIMAEVD